MRDERDELLLEPARLVARTPPLREIDDHEKRAAHGARVGGRGERILVKAELVDVPDDVTGRVQSQTGGEEVPRELLLRPVQPDAPRESQRWRARASRRSPPGPFPTRRRGRRRPEERRPPGMRLRPELSFFGCPAQGAPGMGSSHSSLAVLPSGDNGPRGLPCGLVGPTPRDGLNPAGYSGFCRASAAG